MQEISESAQKMDGSESTYIHLLSHLIEGQRVLILGCQKIYSLCLESAKIGFNVVGTNVNDEGAPLSAGSAIGSDLHKRIQFINSGGANLAFRGSSFDSAIITETLHTAIDLKKILDETARVVRNGGRIIILVENRDHISSAEHTESISKEVLDAELMQYTRKVTWHDLPSEKWLVCSIFVYKHDEKIKEKNEIDIIMPTFNGRGSIKKAIESVIYQTYQNWNLIVVNDGGEDIKDVIDEFNDSRIKYICSEHKGKSHALNVGINCSSGEFIGYLDDDDILYPIHLEVLIKAAIVQECDFIYDDWYEVCIDKSGKEIKRYFEFRQDVSPSMLIFKNYINHKCIIHKRFLLDRVGLYDEDLEVLIDWDMIRRLSFVSRPCHIGSVTSEHIQYYANDIIENKITRLWKMDPQKARASLEKIIKKTTDLPATEMQLKESISEAMMSFSYYHQLQIDSIAQGHTEWINTPFEWGLMRIISDMHSELQNEINRAHALDSELQNEISRANALDSEIAEMRKSFIWTTTNKFHNIFIERVLPNGSKGRKFYDFGLKQLRVLANDGPCCLLWGIKNRIKSRYTKKKNTISSAILEEPFSLQPSEFIPLNDLSNCKIAVVVHVFYVDLFKEICSFLNNIPVRYSLFISINNEEDRPIIFEEAQHLLLAEFVSIKLVPNRGRDIAPFLVDFADHVGGFDYICHIHTKKSLYCEAERIEWRQYLLKMLLGSNERVQAILSVFEKYPSVGIVYPRAFEEVPYWAFTWLSNKHIAPLILQRIGAKFDPDEYIEYPAGSMFWARKSALDPLFWLGLKRNDFPEEKGQTDGTLHHTIERCFAMAAEVQGLRHLLIQEGKGHVFNYKSNKNIHQYYLFPFNLKIRDALPFTSVVSFDIFDTLLIRPFSSPEMVFNYLEERVEAIYGIKGFHKIRKDSEIIVRERKNWQGDVNISEIYSVFAEIAKIDPKISNELLEFEVNTELSILMPRKSVIEMANEIKSAKKKIIIASDTYLEREHIERILAKNSIELYDDLYLSSEVGKRKDGGDLWDYILHQEDVEKNKLLHVGDNEQSDLQILVDRRFMHPVHIIKPSRMFKESKLGETIWQILDPYKGWREDLLFGLCANHFCSNPYPIEFFRSKKPLSDPFSLGYTVFGPIIFNFMSWLLKESRANGVENIKFIAREGFLLHKAFEIIINHPLIKYQGIVFPQGSYFLCSRRASIFAALRTEEDISRLLERHFTGTVKSFFYNRLDVRDMDGIEHLLGAEILEREIIMPDCRDFLFNVIVQVFDVLAQQAEDEREALLEYCEIQGLNSSEKIGLVDIGYSGSIQKALSSLLRKPLAGYYFVTDDLAKPLKYPGSICRAYFGEFIDPANSSLPIHKHSLLLEAVLTAPSGQLLYFQRHNREIVPIFKEPGTSQKEFEKINQIHEGILEFINSILNSFGLNALDIEFPKDSIQLIYDMVAEGDIDIGNLKNVLSVEDNFCGNKELCAIDFYKE
ncbi:rhamnan synthesis F family protein [Methanothrix sp.]|uniref:rhamnan synthesis F family protein n=1 Tax=Methanothrix sp. TaxID=90426 RepID=UPI003BB670BE